MLWPVHPLFRAELDEANKETDEEYKRYLAEMTEEMLNRSASRPLPCGSKLLRLRSKLDRVG